MDALQEYVHSTVGVSLSWSEINTNKDLFEQNKRSNSLYAFRVPKDQFDSVIFFEEERNFKTLPSVKEGQDKYLTGVFQLTSEELECSRIKYKNLDGEFIFKLIYKRETDARAPIEIRELTLEETSLAKLLLKSEVEKMEIDS